MKTSGLGVWTCLTCGQKVVNRGDAPTCTCGEQDVMNFHPEYAASRVTGATYQPYVEFTAWDKRANACMRGVANDNFRRAQQR